MAKIPRHPHAEWSEIDLEAYNIKIQEQDQVLFFGSSLPEYNGLQDFVQHGELESNQELDVQDALSLSLIKRLYLTQDIMEDEETAVADFIIQLLLVMGFEKKHTVLRSHKHFLLEMCYKTLCVKPDVCLIRVLGPMHRGDLYKKILLLIQESKDHFTGVHLGKDPDDYMPLDAEAQLVADAIAAFQAENTWRVREAGLEPLEKRVFPGIVMESTYPRFYKIMVTADLAHCVWAGEYPTTTTIVFRHSPWLKWGNRLYNGMETLNNRKAALQCFEAFKQIVYQCDNY